LANFSNHAAAAPVLTRAVERGVRWLMERVAAGRIGEASPIGFYFAKLWYFEKLYPMIFATPALRRAAGGGKEQAR
jgi:squalene-hopene/tetraprenyl-beta-curcumene cyclase